MGLRKASSSSSIVLNHGKYRVAGLTGTLVKQEPVAFPWQLIRVLVNFGLKCFSCVTVLMFLYMRCTRPLSDAPFYDGLALFFFFLNLSSPDPMQPWMGCEAALRKETQEAGRLPWLDVVVSVSSLCCVAMLDALLSLLRCLEPWGLWWRWLCRGIRTPTNSVLWPAHTNQSVTLINSFHFLIIIILIMSLKSKHTKKLGLKIS